MDLGYFFEPGKVDWKKVFLQSLSPLSCCLASGYGHGHSAVFFSRIDGGELLKVEDVSWIGSLLAVGLMAGTLIGGALSDWIPRRRCVLLSSPLIVLGWAAIASGSAASAAGLTLIYAGRFVTGLGAGAQIPVVHTYLASIVPPRRRGRMTSLAPLLTCVGIVTSYSCGLVLPWRWAAAVGAAFPLFAMLTSPLMVHNDVKGSSSSCCGGGMTCRRLPCRKPRGSKSGVGVGSSSIRSNGSKELIMGTELAGRPTTVQKIASYSFVFRPMVLTGTLFLFQAFTGAMTISYYTSIIFDRFAPDGDSLVNLTSVTNVTNTASAATAPIVPPANLTALESSEEYDDDGVSVAAYLQYGGTLLVGVTYVVGYMLATAVLLPNVTRRAMLIGSGITMAAATAIVAATARFGTELLGPVASSAVTAVSLSAFVLSYSAGFGPVPYVYLGELFPPEYNGLATGTVSMAQCCFTFASLKSFPYMLESMGLVGSFLFSSLVCLAGATFSMLAVPETKDLTADEIGDIFGRKRDWRISADLVAKPEKV